MTGQPSLGEAPSDPSLSGLAPAPRTQEKPAAQPAAPGHSVQQKSVFLDWLLN